MNRLRHFLHRHLWQRLPKQSRRALLFRGTDLFAPAISAHASPREPIIVAGAFRTASGLGQSARLCYQALRACGVRAYGVDLTGLFQQAVDFPDFAFEDGSRLVGQGSLILHVNSPFVPLALTRLGRRLVEGKWVVGYWHWELPSAPDEWTLGVSRVHEIWVPSRFTGSAVGGVAGDRPVRFLTHPVAVNFSAPPRPAAAADRLTVLAAFGMPSGFTRKNPLAAIAAFRAAFGNDARARLVVKVSQAEAYPEGHRALKEAMASLPNGELIDRTVSAEAMAALYEDAAVILSLHRAEGFGLVAAEAMLSARPAVVTDWSSTTDFVTAETGVPVAYRLVPAHDPQGVYDHPDMNWADADVADAAAKLRLLRDPHRRSRIGEAARADAVRRFSAEAYVERLFDHLALSRTGP